VSKFYTPVLVAHMLVAVLGLGSIASVAIVATTTRRSGRALPEATLLLRPLLRCSALSLGAMFATGAFLDLAAAGAFSREWWFRGSALLLFASGVLQGLARRAVRHGFANEGDAEIILRRVEWLAYGMCAMLAVITVLMEVKPF
jgi:hypothetical protein